MVDQTTKLQRIGAVLRDHGEHLMMALIVIIVGIVAIKWINKGLRMALEKVTSNKALIATICNVVNVLLLLIVIIAALVEAGLPVGPVIQLLIIITLCAIGLIVLFRPFLPSLPFKVGNTVKVGSLLGKIEATTALNTRMKTFDGKTFFVPNRQILNDIVINYHFTKTRRIKINVGIRYDQDLMKAKQVLESLMVEDPRVKIKPRPVVYVLNLGDNCVELGARCWVANSKYWVAKCDLTEKIKLRFDYEGIAFAYPQMDIHHYTGETPGMDLRTEKSD